MPTVGNANHTVLERESMMNQATTCNNCNNCGRLVPRRGLCFGDCADCWRWLMLAIQRYFARANHTGLEKEDSVKNEILVELSLKINGEWIETWNVYVKDDGKIDFADARQATRNVQDMINRNVANVPQSGGMIPKERKEKKWNTSRR